MRTLSVTPTGPHCFTSFEWDHSPRAAQSGECPQCCFANMVLFLKNHFNVFQMSLKEYRQIQEKAKGSRNRKATHSTACMAARGQPQMCVRPMGLAFMHRQESHWLRGRAGSVGRVLSTAFLTCWTKASLIYKESMQAQLQAQRAE